MPLSDVALPCPEPSLKLEIEFMSPDDLRNSFALAMSAMYRSEVPLYGDLVRLVQSVNESVIAKHRATVADTTTTSSITTTAERLSLERHGAIRLGTSYELRTIRRLFAILGMYPVGYYDLSVAGLPVHATCFRPVSSTSLQRNPFRVFTSLLRPGLIRSEVARRLALSLLGQRSLFSNELLSLLRISETQQNGLLTSSQAEIFITEALKTFGWQQMAASTYAQYAALSAEHPILADIACFQSAHINHLTPRTLDIAIAQDAMRAEGMAVKSRIEGPPARTCPILLRQTSFLALEEPVKFPVRETGKDGCRKDSCGFVDASHTARFGEIEERGVAVTAAGRLLYDQLLHEAMDQTSSKRTMETADAVLARVFKKYPDNWTELRRKQLAYFEYKCAGEPTQTALADLTKGKAENESVLDVLIRKRVIESHPITYEDFLPFSAAGIFQSNLQSSAMPRSVQPSHIDSTAPKEDLKGFETSLGCMLLDSEELYRNIQTQSLERCARELGLTLSDLTC